MDKESWYKVMGENIQYPFEIETVYINKIDNETIDNSCEKYQDSTVSIQLLEENTTVLEIQSYISNNIEIEGKLKT